MTKYYDQLIDSESKKSFLGLTIYGMIFLCITVVFLWYKSTTKQQPVYYIPGATQPGIAYPNEVPDSAVISFATTFILTNANYTPVTVKDAFDLTSKYMSPELLSYSSSTLESLIKKVENKRLSSQYSITSTPILTPLAVGYRVSMTGWETLYYGGTEVSKSRVKYETVIKRVSPTENNPYGMIVCSIEKRPLK